MGGWKKLQYTKKEGGLGFKDLPKFNDALLAKQAWRIYSKPDCLFSKLYKARYLKDKQLLEGRRCRSQSYGWASLLAGIELLKKGCTYIVGNGKDIRVFKDNWLPVNSPRPASTTINCDLRVIDLITTSSYKHWNPMALQSYLCDEDQRLVRRIYLSQTDKEDRLIWSHTQDGNYMVSSGYTVARHAPEFLVEAPPVPYGDPILKNKVWKLNIMPKLKHFLWRLLSKAIGTATRLNSRGMHLDPICQRCGLAEETIDHCFFTCPDSISVWRCANLPFTVPLCTSDSMDNKIGFLLQIQGLDSLSLYQRLLPFWLQWRIWKKINFLLFRKQILPPNVTVDNACADVREWISYLCLSSTTINNTSAGVSSQLYRHGNVQLHTF